MEILKRKEHHVRYFKIRQSEIPKLEDHIFMGIKIEHLYIHDCSKNNNLKSGQSLELFPSVFRAPEPGPAIHLVAGQLAESPGAVKELPDGGAFEGAQAAQEACCRE